MIDKGSIYKPEVKVRQFGGISSGQSHFSGLFLLHDGMCVGTLKLLTPWGLVFVLVQPIGNLGVIPPLFTETAYRVIQELLILGIGCNPEIGKTNFYGEGKKDISSVILWGFLPPYDSIPPLRNRVRVS